MVKKFFDEKSATTDATKYAGSGAVSNQQLADELHKLIITKFKRHKVYPSLKDSIWGTDPAVVQ